MKKLLLSVGLVGWTAVSASTSTSAKATADKQAPDFPWTVDSIMRGPELVGNPPSSLRWSGDSKELYFEADPQAVRDALEEITNNE